MDKTETDICVLRLKACYNYTLEQHSGYFANQNTILLYSHTTVHDSLSKLAGLEKIAATISVLCLQLMLYDSHEAAYFHDFVSIVSPH